MAKSNHIEVDDALLRRWALPIPDGGDKEVRGHVLIVAGSRDIPGSAVLAATAALRAGAGKVTVATPACVAPAMAFAVPESRVIALRETKAGRIAPAAADALDDCVGKTNALLIGPGLWNNPEVCSLTNALLKKFSEAAIMLDAGAMGVVSKKHNREMRFSTPVLLTPHAGEMASLNDCDKDEISREPERAAVEAARHWNAIVALKGAITHIAAPGGRVWRHEGGNSGLAISGSGDVLAGIIAGLAARGVSLEQASVWGVALHARAGVKLADRLGPLGYLARELAGEVPGLMASLGPRSSKKRLLKSHREFNKL